MAEIQTSDFHVMTPDEIESKLPTFYLVGSRKCGSIDDARDAKIKLKPIALSIFACYPVESASTGDE